MSYAEKIEALVAERDAAIHQAAEWRENFAVLQRALVGETGASGIEVAHALRKDAERYCWLLSRLTAYDMDGPALLFSWPAGVAFKFGAPADSIDAAMAGLG